MFPPARSSSSRVSSKALARLIILGPALCFLLVVVIYCLPQVVTMAKGGDYTDLHELAKGWKAAIVRATDPATK